jgi:hypothetical protein
LPDPQSASVKQLALQAPVAWLQYGAPLPQGWADALPKLPLHAAHALEAVSQIGVVPPHAAVFPDKHCTHWFDAEHTGVAARQSVSAPHASHLPAFAPLPTHTPLRHCAVEEHVPSPSAYPHLPSAASHAPLRHADAPLHAAPFACLGWQVPAPQ